MVQEIGNNFLGGPNTRQTPMFETADIDDVAFLITMKKGHPRPYLLSSRGELKKWKIFWSIDQGRKPQPLFLLNIPWMRLLEEIFLLYT